MVSPSRGDCLTFFGVFLAVSAPFVRVVEGGAPALALQATLGFLGFLSRGHVGVLLLARVIPCAVGFLLLEQST